MESSAISGAAAPIIQNMKTWVVGAFVIAAAYGGVIYYLSSKEIFGTTIKAVGSIIAACTLAAWTFYILF